MQESVEVPNELGKTTTADSVFLKTARGDISSVQGGEKLNARILMDEGSMRSYITPEAKERLKLKLWDRKNQRLKHLEVMWKPGFMTSLKFSFIAKVASG